MSDTGLTIKKEEDFSEWYTQLVLKSELADYAPVKGCMIFREYSYAIWERIQEIFNKKIRVTGHRNVYFPLFIPESFLRKEAEHFEGFVPEVAWVTVGGNTQLEERLAVRPTSETIIYATFAKWVRSWRDLPIKLNQWCSVVRWETKATRLFLRTREFLWQEGHTVHVSKEEADEEAMQILRDYRDVMENYLAIPVLVGRKTESEKFAGALYTITLEALMPDGRALQMGTSHNLGQHFSKVFDIKFLDESQKEQYPWQTSWGISTRTIGALIMVHSDDKGLILPPKIAPIHVVVVPIPYKDAELGTISDKARQICENLRRTGLECVLDDRSEYTPGWKFNHWELKGVPIRVEIGPRDLKQGQVTIVRRDNCTKMQVKEEEASKTILRLLEDIQENLFNRAKRTLEEGITAVLSYEEFREVLKEKGGFIQASWCEDTLCERKIKEETGATIRLIPISKETPRSKCVYCGKEALQVVYFARAY